MKNINRQKIVKKEDHLVLIFGIRNIKLYLLVIVFVICSQLRYTVKKQSTMSKCCKAYKGRMKDMFFRNIRVIKRVLKLLEFCLIKKKHPFYSYLIHI